MKSISIPVSSSLAHLVVGSIITDPDPRVLSEDMVELSLPSGIFIHAGWRRALGRYEICVDCGLAELVPPLSTDDPYEAAYEVAQFASYFSGGAKHAYSSESTNTSASVRIVAGRLVAA